MNLLKLKNLLNDKIEVIYGYNMNPEGAMQLYWWINEKYDVNGFMNLIKTLKEGIFEKLISLESFKIAQQTLSEYEGLLEKFTVCSFKGNEFLKFNNFTISRTDFFFIDGKPETWGVTEERKKEILDYLAAHDQSMENWEKAALTEIHEITNSEAAEVIDLISRHIQKILEQIVSFSKSMYTEDSSQVFGKRDLDRLNVKQQVPEPARASKAVINYTSSYKYHSFLIPNVTLIKPVYDFLIRREYINYGDFKAFERIFSGKPVINKIPWLSSKERLNYIVTVLKRNKIIEDYRRDKNKLIADCFCDQNGKPYFTDDFSAIHQPKDSGDIDDQISLIAQL